MTIEMTGMILIAQATGKVAVPGFGVTAHFGVAVLPDFHVKYSVTHLGTGRGLGTFYSPDNARGFIHDIEGLLDWASDDIDELEQRYRPLIAKILTIQQTWGDKDDADQEAKED